MLSKSLHSKYVKHLESGIKCNPKSFWSFIKSKKSQSNFPSSMLFNDVVATDSQSSANLFASYFESVYVKSDVNVDITKFNNIKSLVDIGSLTVSEQDILTAISSLNNSVNLDVNGICPLFLKSCASSLCHPLKILFNLSLRSGIFPDDLKIGLICPIFKKGDKCLVSNYRPITKMSCLSKVLELVVKTKLSFLTKQVICDCQHGFVKGRSTLTNLALFNKYCVNTLVQNLQVDVVYTDFEKAFDTVLHSVLLTKLSLMGFHGTFLMWLRSYLSNRKCAVVVDNCVSYSFVGSSGVPQGSTLGPLLFLYFINDISSWIKNSCCLLYADDLKIFKSVKCSYDVLLLQSDLDNLLEWCNINHLNLNIPKCFYMCVSRARSVVYSSYKIGNSSLIVVDHMLDLGVMFDSKLSFANHIEYILPKAFVALSFIKRHAANFTDLYTLKLLYFAFVRSRLEYASFIWNPSAETHIKRIDRVQKIFTKFALRILFNNSDMPTASARNLLLGLKTLKSRRDVASLLFIHDLVSGNLDCANILKLVNFSIPVKCLRSCDVFNVTLVKSNYAKFEPITRALNLFNRLSRVHSLDLCMHRSSFARVLNELL